MNWKRKLLLRILSAHVTHTIKSAYTVLLSEIFETLRPGSRNRFIAADPRVTQMVDGNKGIHCVLARSRMP